MARGEGQGAVIELTVRPAPREALEGSPELLQSPFWADFKGAHGWTAHVFDVGFRDARFPLLVLTRRLLKLLRLAYVPFGPTFDPVDGRGPFLASLASALRPLLPRGTFLLRFDLPWDRSGSSPAEGPGAKLRKAPDDIQPPATVLVDLRPPEEEILAGMKPKTRYNVRLAAKRGVEVVTGTAADFESWYELYRETSRRDGIAIHAPSYYRGLFEAAAACAGPAPTVQLLLAKAGGELLAGNIVLFWKYTAIYLTGASSGSKRNLMPTYALQWEAIRRAKAAGCLVYDLYGIPPEPEPSQAMFGLYQFKTGFSPRILQRWGCWDAQLLPVASTPYAVAERLRMAWHRGVKKQLAGRTGRRPRGGAPQSDATGDTAGADLRA